MPTGYTAEIIEKNGITFQQFAMNCARAFGALIEMRDKPNDAEIPEEFTPSSYHEQAYKDAVDEMARLSRMTPAEQDAFGEARKIEEVKRAKEWLARDTAENAKFHAMREKVQAWEPPTKDHHELKSFMLQQIDISIGDTGYVVKHVAKVEASTPHSYYREAIESAGRNIKYHGEGIDKDKERAKSRTEWVQQLRKSLEVAP